MKGFHKKILRHFVPQDDKTGSVLRPPVKKGLKLLEELLRQALEGLAAAGFTNMSWTQEFIRKRLQHKPQIVLADWLAHGTERNADNPIAEEYT